MLELIPDAKVLAAYYAAPSPETLKNAETILEKSGITLSDYEFYSDITDSELKEYIAKQFAQTLAADIKDADTAFTVALYFRR